MKFSASSPCKRLLNIRQTCRSTDRKIKPSTLAYNLSAGLPAVVLRTFLLTHRLCGLMVKASAQRLEDPGLESRLRRDFSGLSQTSDLKIGTPVATLPGVWRYRVSAGTGRPGVSILCLGEVECLICNFYLCVAARKIV